jgi:hypothetical protein
MLLSPAQRRVLEWLRAYPGVRLAGGGAEYPSWTASWVNEAARQDMVKVVGQAFGIDASKTAPRTLAFLNQATPRCTRRTFAALLRSGYLAKRSSHRTIPFYGYFGISAEGRAAVEQDERSGIPVEFESPQERPLQRCECGWSGRSMGGHRAGPWHREWLAVQAYRAEVALNNSARDEP